MSRRRLGQLAALLAAGWLVIAFGRQVADASAATTRAEDLRAQNAALRDEVAALQDDLARVQDGSYVNLAGRAVGLGGRGEIPFTLEPGAATPGPDAPGSASVRLGARHDTSSPLEGWLEALFGPRS
jgi:cell division protein FtsB